MLPIEPVVLQAAADFTTTAHDVTVHAFGGTFAFNFPWGDNLADEGFVGAIIYLVKSALTSWENVETDRAVFGDDD